MNRHKFRLWDGKQYRYVESLHFIGDELYAKCTDNGSQALQGALEEYINLNDKNGAAVFEGDILRGKRYGKDATCVVKWLDDYEGDGWILRGYVVDLDDHHDIEIIGNINENKELLLCQHG